jgi:hypothetical protein
MIDDGGLALGAQVRAKRSERDRVGLQGSLVHKNGVKVDVGEGGRLQGSPPV